MSGDRAKLDRACGTLLGMAIGDAMGMPSQTLTRSEIYAHYGTISTYLDPFDDHPVSHGLSAASVTDDTEQAFLLADRLIEDGGALNTQKWARDLLAWEEDVRRRGLRDLLGPSSKAALDAILAGASPDETGRNGTTNGAAMRIAPVGIATQVEPLPVFLDQVEQACRITHNTGEAIAAAGAVAAMISCGIDGEPIEVALETSLRVAAEGQKRGFVVGSVNIAQKIAAALSAAKAGLPIGEFADHIGTSVASHESVPAAFGVVQLAGGDPWRAAMIAASIGDDTDTIGAIAGAMAGAFVGRSGIALQAVQPVIKANSLPIDDIANALLDLRAGEDRRIWNGAEGTS